MAKTHPVAKTQKVIIGLDVAKEALETVTIEASSGATLCKESYPNSKAGHRQLIEQIRRYEEAHVIMEATGSYHLHLVEALEAAGLCQSVVNPLVIKRFGQMKMRRIKTDQSDAMLLASYGQEQKPQPCGAEPAVQQQLKQIATLLDQLVKQRTALQNVAHAQGLIPNRAPVCADVLSHQLGEIERSIERLEAERERLAGQHFRQVRTLIESVKGVGAKTASTLIAYVGDLSRFEDYRQLSAYMGLNPVPNQSGARDARRHISKQGHARLRTLMYLCAQSARRYNRACRALYERLIAAGKQRKVALIAAANKLIKQIFAVVKSGTMYDDNYATNYLPAA